ncbi:hypothetical protein [Cyanobium sp. Morenito 9A2]|uniref:hypothetical protein n=1 Tax=Cyanobium sp. Morenito 9A2 TaxID=2823718 RepID=UPI0020CD7E37|nr:hypothetical protein [Cyanobium sp. Morenito 9A2]MCP9848559.1 hypothetical protein [Cyanobium sp. Morenito 9A2]
MTTPLFALTALTVVLLTAVATVPELLRLKDPRVTLAPPQESRAPWVVVRAGGGSWFLNGSPIGAVALAAQLKSAPPEGSVRLLVSSALATGEVSRSLAWLRQQSRQPVLLELAQGPR